MQEIWIFLGKSTIIFVTFVLIAVVIAFLFSKNQGKSDFEVDSLTDRWKDIEHWLKSFVLQKSELKAENKKAKKELKNKEPFNGNVFVLKFTGDVQATQVENLREEITAILQIAQPNDEIVICIESPGGVVSGYGHAASQILRLREAELKVVACVDEVAASGGYMMACVASRILAAPFAIVGSIGVVASVPNFNKLLKKNDVEYHEYTSGEYKRTVSLLGEITEKGERKFLEQIEQTHVLFKEFVGAHRPQVNLAEVATGEYWYGQRALSLHLIDHIQTSDDYLLECNKKNRHVISIAYREKKKLSEKLSNFLGQSADVVFSGLINKILQKFLNSNKISL